MKVKYEFANETVYIDVEDQWVTILEDLDRLEYNSNQRETRRHCSLEAYNLDDALLPSEVDVPNEVFEKIDRETLSAAIAELQPQQQVLVERVFFKGDKLAEIAREEGVSKMALTNRMKKIYASLAKKFN